MKSGVPPHVSSELQSDEALISYIPEPDLPARRRIILAILPLFAALALTLLWFFTDRTSVIAGAAAVYCVAALSVFALRLCRTSYVISARRVVRFVGEKKVEDVVLAESNKPWLLDFSKSGSFLPRWAARFLSLGQIVEIKRHAPKSFTFQGFFTNRDPSRMRIGYPGHSLSIARILDEVTRAWDAAQDMPKASK